MTMTRTLTHLCPLCLHRFMLCANKTAAFNHHCTLFLLYSFSITVVSQMATSPSNEPKVTFIPEMQSPSGNFNYDPAECQGILSLEQLEKFHQEWLLKFPRVLSKITKAQIVENSKWAQEETQRSLEWPPQLPDTFAHNLAMTPLAVSKSGSLVRLVHPQEQGIKLPAHSPLVQRKLCFYVDFNRDSNTIEEITVTIRGWREE